MKKIVKNMAAKVHANNADTVAPKWFSPAMREILKDYPTKDDLDQKLSGFATADNLIEMSQHLVKIFLDRLDEQDRKFFSRMENNAKTLGNHETRIVSLERRLT
ncbi:MAG: hypothetical protein WC101_03460 [Candidatus Gracilibacteria bacterium]